MGIGSADDVAVSINKAGRAIIEHNSKRSGISLSLYIDVSEVHKTLEIVTYKYAKSSHRNNQTHHWWVLKQLRLVHSRWIATRFSIHCLPVKQELFHHVNDWGIFIKIKSWSMGSKRIEFVEWGRCIFYGCMCNNQWQSSNKNNHRGFHNVSPRTTTVYTIAPARTVDKSIDRYIKESYNKNAAGVTKWYAAWLPDTPSRLIMDAAH
jgi:hypothetical protein